MWLKTLILCSKVPSKCRKCHFRDPKFKKFSGEHAPGPPYNCRQYGLPPNKILAMLLSERGKEWGLSQCLTLWSRTGWDGWDMCYGKMMVTRWRNVCRIRWRVWKEDRGQHGIRWWRGTLESVDWGRRMRRSMTNGGNCYGKPPIMRNIY